MKVLGCISKLIALVFTVLFILLAPIALLFLNVNWQLLQSGIYKTAFAENGVYERLPALVAESLDGSFVANPCEQNPNEERCKQDGPADPHQQVLYPIFSTTSPQLRNCLRQVLGTEAFDALSAGKRVAKGEENVKIKLCLRQYGLPTQGRTQQGGAPLYLFLLDRSDWEAILSALLPAGWSQAQTESVLDQIFAFLDIKSDAVRVSLVELKERLHGDAGKVLITRILRAQPPCSVEQLARLTRASVNIEDIQLCRPQDAVFELTVSQLRSSAGQVWDKIPDAAVLIEETKRADALPKDARGGGFFPAENPREAISRVRLVLNLGALLVPLVFLGLMALFGARSFSELMRGWGVPLFVAGAICGSVSVLVLYGLDSVAAIFLDRGKLLLSGFTPNVVQMLLNVGKQIARAFSVWLGIESALVFFLGLALFSGSFLIRRRA